MTFVAMVRSFWMLNQEVKNKLYISLMQHLKGVDNTYERVKVANDILDEINEMVSSLPCTVKELVGIIPDDEEVAIWKSVKNAFLIYEGSPSQIPTILLDSKVVRLVREVSGMRYGDYTDAINIVIDMQSVRSN